MSTTIRALGIVQSLSLLMLIAILLRPHAPWSVRLRAPVAILAAASSGLHLILTIL